VREHWRAISSPSLQADVGLRFDLMWPLDFSQVGRRANPTEMNYDVSHGTDTPSKSIAPEASQLARTPQANGGSGAGVGANTTDRSSSPQSKQRFPEIGHRVAGQYIPRFTMDARFVSERVRLYRTAI
jgi:hypothetical protein